MEADNPFKQLGQPPKEVPNELKQKVMNDVGAAKLLMDMAALFTTNYKNTLGSMFKTNKKSK